MQSPLFWLAEGFGLSLGELKDEVEVPSEWIVWDWKSFIIFSVVVVEVPEPEEGNDCPVVPEAFYC